MAATLSRVITDRLGNEEIIVHPDSDSQLNDPAFQAKGTQQQYDLPYRGWGNRRSFLVFLQQKAADAGRVILAALIQKRIDLIDAIAQFEADLAVWQNRVELWPDPTPAQQLLINAARNQFLLSRQAVQGIRDDIAALIAQVP